MARILIAEDEPRIVSFISKGLRQAGYEVQAAYNGQQALSLLQSNAFDLMLLDLMLPIIDGQAVLRELQAQNSQMPIIVVTAVTDTAIQKEIFELGAKEYISKPFRFTELLACIRRYI